MTYGLLLLIHLLAAAFWVGGMAVMHFAVRPAAVVTLEPPLRLPFLTAALGRFFAGVTTAIVLLLASGLGLIALAGGFASLHWGAHAMVGIGLMMMAIFGHIRLGPFRRLQSAVAVREWPKAASQVDTIRRLVALNLMLGTLVFVLAVAAPAA